MYFLILFCSVCLTLFPVDTTIFTWFSDRNEKKNKVGMYTHIHKYMCERIHKYFINKNTYITYIYIYIYIYTVDKL